MRKKANDGVLPAGEVRGFISNRSDLQGLSQLCFHACFAAVAMLMVQRARESGSIVAPMIAELALGFIASFYFMGFHEFIHGTAFDTNIINKVLGSIVGFFIFRGSKWYYFFHWNHHRYTNDPDLDPELSGTTVDRDDPLSVSGWAGMKSYAIFLSGYPFGFERLPSIFLYALGCGPQEIWADTPKKR